MKNLKEDFELDLKKTNNSAKGEQPASTITITPYLLSKAFKCTPHCPTPTTNYASCHRPAGGDVQFRC